MYLHLRRVNSNDPALAHLNSSHVELKDHAHFSVHLLKLPFLFFFWSPSAIAQIDMMYTQRLLKIIISQLFLLNILAIGLIRVMQ